jgi:hypothetical protein
MTPAIMPVVERRAAPRSDKADLPDDLCGRVRPGHAIRVIDLSLRGALVESSRRLLPGSRVEVLLECCEFRHVTRARVVRCYVGVLLPHAVRFRAAIEFDRDLERWRTVGEPLTLDVVDSEGSIAVVWSHSVQAHGRSTAQSGR